jgi:hypothetical protein
LTSHSTSSHSTIPSPISGNIKSIVITNNPNN